MLNFLCSSIARSNNSFSVDNHTSELPVYRVKSFGQLRVPSECMCVSFSILSRQRVSLRCPSSFFIAAKLWRRSLYVALRIRVCGWKRTGTTPRVQSTFVAVDPISFAHSDRFKVFERFPGVPSKRSSYFCRARFYTLHHRYHRATCTSYISTKR